MDKKQTIFNCFVTLQCNLNCPYCFVKKAKTKFNIDKVPDNLDYSNYTYVCILGGEPGLLELKDVQKLIDKLSYIPKEKLIVATNGVFLKKYQKYYPDINYCYHITDFENPVFYEKVTNQIILTSKNAEQVLEFIKKYSDTKFRINENMFETLLSKPKILKIIKEIMKLSNLTFNKVIKTDIKYKCLGSVEAFDYL